MIGYTIKNFIFGQILNGYKVNGDKGLSVSCGRTLCLLKLKSLYNTVPIKPLEIESLFFGKFIRYKGRRSLLVFQRLPPCCYWDCECRNPRLLFKSGCDDDAIQNMYHAVAVDIPCWTPESRCYFRISILRVAVKSPAVSVYK